MKSTEKNKLKEPLRKKRQSLLHTTWQVEHQLKLGDDAKKWNQAKRKK